MRQGFVLGSARCGSTLVSDILRLHPAILSLSEVFSTAGPNAFPQGRISGARFWQGLAKPTRFASAIANPDRAPREFLYGRTANPRFDPWFCPPILQIALPHLSEDPDELFQWLEPRALAAPRQDPGAHYRSLFAQLATQLDRRVWVERSGGSIIATRTLLDQFPGARHLLLTRNGADTVLSMADYPATRIAVWMWKRLRPFGMDLMSPRTHYGRGRIWRMLQSAGGMFPVSRILDTPPKLADVGTFWSQMMLRGAQAMQAIPPGDLAHLSYENLIAAPREQIRNLGEFFADDAPDGWLDQAAALPQQRRARLDDLSQTDRLRLLDSCAEGEAAIAGFLATRFGRNMI